MYRITREKLGWSSAGPPSALVNNGRSITKPRDITECMSDFFDSKIKDLKNSIPTRTQDPLNLLSNAMNDWEGADARQEFELQEVTLADVVKVIKELNNSPTMGHDELDTVTLKLVVNTVIGPIKHIINMSIRTRKYPNKWKIGKLLPLLKGSDLD